MIAGYPPLRIKKEGGIEFIAVKRLDDMKVTVQRAKDSEEGTLLGEKRRFPEEKKDLFLQAPFDYPLSLKGRGQSDKWPFPSSRTFLLLVCLLLSLESLHTSK